MSKSTVEQDEKSEDMNNVSIQEPIFRDSEGLVGVSVTAQEVAIMADVSEHVRKKKSTTTPKKKKKDKKNSTKTLHMEGDEDTDVETERVRSSSVRHRKKKHSKKKVRKKDGETTDGSTASGKQHKSKTEKKKHSKKKKRKKTSKAKDDIDTENENAEITSLNNGLSSNQGDAEMNVDENEKSYLHDFPPYLDSDSMSSELPDPSNLDMDESSDYESDNTSSNVDHPEMCLSSIPGSSLLGEAAFVSENNEVDFPLSPQSIPGSLANEIMETPNEPHSTLDTSGKMNISSKRDWKCWGLFDNKQRRKWQQ